MLIVYNYDQERSRIFTEDGQALFLKMYDRAKQLISVAGAARLAEIMSKATGDSFLILACMDRMVEMGVLKEATDPKTVWGQDRIFTLPREA
jgi:hypothetical protein